MSYSTMVDVLSALTSAVALLLAFRGFALLYRPRARSIFQRLSSQSRFFDRAAFDDGKKRLALDLASDKFVRSQGACFVGIAVSVYLLPRQSFAHPRDIVAAWAGLLPQILSGSVTGVTFTSHLAALVHFLAQCSTGLRGLIKADALLKECRPNTFVANPLTYQAVRNFAFFSIVVSLGGLLFHLPTVFVYHALASVHNGISASEGLFGWKKTCTHGATATLAAYALIHNS